MSTALPPVDETSRGGASRWSMVSRRLLRGRDGDPIWARPALVVLLVVAALLYGWGLGASGWANSFYSAAAQAGSTSWKAWFFGSFDAANFITVDKTPGALWVSGLSVRLFGLNPWSILVPQALEGVATVALLYAVVRRWFGPGPALLSGAVLATTPVATLMFRYNNPDALLMLALVAGAYALVRAVEDARTGWLVLAGACVGFGFLTKMLQALLVLPAFALAYLVFAPAPVGRRVRQVLLGGAAMVASAGWWVAIVELTPARYRPYVGGSTDNSVMQLALGYNGFGRLTGNEIAGFDGRRFGFDEPGWGRMFGAATGGQIAWLLPAAVLLCVAGLALAGRSAATPTQAGRWRAAYVLWGGWLVVTALVLSLMHGIFHPYYTLALAPAVAALAGMGAHTLWRLRCDRAGSLLLAAVVAGTAAWSCLLLDRSAAFHPWLRAVVAVTGLLAAVALTLFTRPAGQRRRDRRWTALLAAVAAATALVAVLAGPVAYCLQTVAAPRSGPLVSAGPAVPGARAGRGGGMDGASPDAGISGGGRTTGTFGMARLLADRAPDPRVRALLTRNAGAYTWVVATIGSRGAATYQLATGRPAMAVGGFSGTDPAPTLAQFQRDVAAKRIHYFIDDPFARAFGGSHSSDSAQIAGWVQHHYPASTIDGITIYDLSR
ncbi:ArnT family glycosyltransferase [Dactylosporangium sp. NPDC048998]|uniref:ArnT family glycosyltransferase n=1 Tax=Dactylosporangium sp. NPDC048998 TaxID=3363976 RepID=UPI003715DE3E